MKKANKNSCIRHAILTLAFMAISSTLNAESFRVSKVHIASVSQETGSEASVKLGINDALSIQLPEDKIFIEGLELKFEIPEAVAYWMDSVACSVYANIKPKPTESQIDYSGTRSYVSTLPGKLSWVLQVPLSKENTIKSNNYTTKVDTVLTPEENVLFVRLQPVMKGVPEETLNSKIPITVKPILANKGLLKLDIKSPENEKAECSVFIDDKIANLKNGKIMLETGIHNISIISEKYRNELRTVRIDQAKQTELSVEMKSIEPTLLVTAPDGTKILLDGEEFNNPGTEVVITEGEHKLSFSIGDYELVRTISATKGKTYKASFSLDLEVTEE
ncbi:MAG: hypothetical protein K5681_10930 [Treponema sp.]|nr:hypothetical protein [Treponema sp.]